MSFEDLGLSPDLLRAVAESGYTTPTPIQQQAIPQLLIGRDVVGVAQTGTGKTAGFTLPMIEILANGRARARMPRSLILEPTRELAAQVAENFQKYGKYHPRLSMALLIGGVSMDDQVAKLDRGVDVLIATPGRLLDHFERGKVLLADIKILVIDEADRMLDMGFIPDVERIIKMLPKIRQTVMFSATMPPEVRRLADNYMTNPRRVEVAPSATAAETVKQHLVPVSGDFASKRSTLRRLIEAEDVKNAIVFCNRKRDVSVVAKSLTQHGFSAAPLHGDLPQPVRMETLDRFKKGEIRLLVASDVAARGLDIVDMSHVFCFDVPINAEDYVHRIGRTGRAGREGRAYMLASSADGRYVGAIEKLIGTKIPRADDLGKRDVPAAEGEVVVEATADDAPAPRTRRRRGAKPAEEGAETAERPARKRRTRKATETVAKPVPVVEPDDADDIDVDEDDNAPIAPIQLRRTPAAAPAPVRAAAARRGERGRRNDDGEDAAVGFGDDVPAFLRR
ncbi:MAG: DEAD/DEAH box helicase [Alphaproteobacteria bacterium]